jgi:hypothetical protein
MQGPCIERQQSLTFWDWTGRKGQIVPGEQLSMHDDNKYEGGYRMSVTAIIAMAPLHSSMGLWHCPTQAEGYDFRQGQQGLDVNPSTFSWHLCEPALTSWPSKHKERVIWMQGCTKTHLMTTPGEQSPGFRTKLKDQERMPGDLKILSLLDEPGAVHRVASP